MTLILCLKGSDGIVLASDSRGTFGDPREVTAQNDTIRKIYPVSKYVGVLVAGSGELGATIMDALAREINEDKADGATLIMNLSRDLLKSRFGEWFPKFLIQPVPNAQAPMRPVLSLIVAGYDLDPSCTPEIQRIYSLNSLLDFAPMLHDYGFALQGVGQYALYLLNRLYAPDSEVDNLLPLAAYVITETASQDGKVGGPVQMMKITLKDGCGMLSSEDINRIIESNKSRSEKLKVSFFMEKK